MIWAQLLHKVDLSKGQGSMHTQWESNSIMDRRLLLIKSSLRRGTMTS